MFKSTQPLTFVRAEELQGISKKTNNPYHIRQVTLSDGIESFTLPFTETTKFDSTAPLTRGSKVFVELSIEQRGQNSQAVVTNVTFAK